MLLVPVTQVGKWLEQKYLDWQKESGGRRSLAEFARYLGTSPGGLNNWINGHREPKNKSVDLLASKLGPEIYDMLGLRRPGESNPYLQKLEQVWHLLPEERQRYYADKIESETGEERGDEPSPSTSSG